MGTRIEALNSQNQWQLTGFELKPGINPASFSDVSRGGRDVYVVSCSDDNRFSYVDRSVSGLDLERGSEKEIRSTRLERIATLTTASAPFEISIQTEKMPVPIQLRVVHTDSL